MIGRVLGDLIPPLSSGHPVSIPSFKGVARGGGGARPPRNPGVAKST